VIAHAVMIIHRNCYVTSLLIVRGYPKGSCATLRDGVGNHAAVAAAEERRFYEYEVND
jgi:hypothetical protein